MIGIGDSPNICTFDGCDPQKSISEYTPCMVYEEAVSISAAYVAATISPQRVVVNITVDDGNGVGGTINRSDVLCTYVT